MAQVMMQGVRESRAEDETEAIAAEFARDLQGGEVIFLEGDLGAGKTAFVRGLARGLGAPEDAVPGARWIADPRSPKPLAARRISPYGGCAN